jgi:predicted dehydrogenase
MDGLPARAAREQMNKIGIGMIGAGFIGQIHSLTFGSVGVARREPSLSGRLIALADTNLDLAREVQERYGWERISTDWHQALDDPAISIFINSGPNDAHAEPTAAAAAAKKHLFSEKPLARTANETFTIWQAAHDAGVRHMCALAPRAAFGEARRRGHCPQWRSRPRRGHG